MDTIEIKYDCIATKEVPLSMACKSHKEKIELAKGVCSVFNVIANGLWNT